MNVSLCCIAKWENLYIRDFVEYYEKIGFSNITIYDNNEKSDEHFEDVIKDYIDSGFVRIVDVRGMGCGLQMRVYSDFYSRYHNEYDWIAFFDVDEYLLLKKDKTISDYLSRDCFNKFNCIHVNWVMFDDNDLLRYTPVPVMDRFTRPVYDENNESHNIHIKTIVKCLPCVNHIVFPTPHHCEFEGIHVCDGSGKEVSNTWNISHGSRDLAQLNHYHCKTVEEFVMNRRNKGGADCFRKVRSYKDLFDMFFSISKNTDEKIKVFDECIKRADSGERLSNGKV